MRGVVGTAFHVVGLTLLSLSEFTSQLVGLGLGPRVALYLEVDITPRYSFINNSSRCGKLKGLHLISRIMNRFEQNWYEY